MASEFSTFRSRSCIGVETVRAWARSLEAGASILDVGCGSGVPISTALVDDGFELYGVDASPTLVAEFRRNLPGVAVACETVEDSGFFHRTFDGIVAVGLLFLLPANRQIDVMRKIAAALEPGGGFLFSSPREPCSWSDSLTGRPSVSLGHETYERVLGDTGLHLVSEYDDEGDNHYFSALRP